MRRQRPQQGRIALHGLFGLCLISVFWYLNWNLEGPRTHWGFFPLWLGYSLTVDGIVLIRTGTSLIARDRARFIGLFLMSIPAWWVFEAINLRTQNWRYLGTEGFSPLAYAFWTTVSFSTVMPAVFETSELMASFGWFSRWSRGPRLGVGKSTVRAFFVGGWVMLAVLLLWPRLFFPFVWISLFFILEPVNLWLGHPSVATHTRRGDWRPIASLWCGVLITAFFWEMWNSGSYPKWVYDIPLVDRPRLFEMPLLGYVGYLPFALELSAMYHLFAGLLRLRSAGFPGQVMGSED
jgi:hypothetical protein